MAVYAIGVTLGSGCAYLVGRMIVELVSQADTILLPIVGEVRSWQAVFFIVGIPGAFLSLLIFTVPEPPRRGPRAEQRHASSIWRSTLGAYEDRHGVPSTPAADRRSVRSAFRHRMLPAPALRPPSHLGICALGAAG